MIKKNDYEFWFITGSQNLYGSEVLETVEKDSTEIVNELNQSNHIKYPIQFKAVVKTADEIQDIILQANSKANVAGVITWMHTFSPAKMWIPGLKKLQKPMLHFSTQYKSNIPWNEIDMDYMNTHQSAHGDREFGFINRRLELNNKIVFGHWKESKIQSQIGRWLQSAIGYSESQNVRVVRFGDNMRNVAVTEGDKIEAAIQFGWTVDYYGIGDLVEVLNEVSNGEVSNLYEELSSRAEFDYGKNSKNHFESQVKEQLKIEIGLKKFMEEHNYNAFTTNFEDLHGMKQLPGLAVQRLNLQGYGFAGEGDWKTAALSRLFKAMTDNESTGFMEDYTYDFTEGSEKILGSHMLEVDPTLANDKPTVIVEPLGIGGKEDPARLIFDGKSGDGVVVAIIDLGNKYQLIINEIEAIAPSETAPNLPVGRVLWTPKPDFYNGVKQWMQAGGGHHTVLSLALTSEQIIDWAKMVNLDYILIK